MIDLENKRESPTRRLSRARGLAAFLVVFAAGLLGGAALDRAYVSRVTESAGARRRSLGNTEVAIPSALAQLHLTSQQEERIRAIAASLRPTTDSLWNLVRPRALGVEERMFQRSLCVLTPEQLAKWKEYMNTVGATPQQTARRLDLVTSGTCPDTSGKNIRQ